MKTIIQVVQHLTPGGIEVLALEMLRLKERDTNMLIVSLEGTLNPTLKNWPRLEPFKKNLIFLNKQPGYSLNTLIKLTSLFRQIQPTAVHTHHIGPLLYAGLAAKITAIKTIIHTEHDAWHLKDKKRLILEKSILKIVQPKLVADSKSVKIAIENFMPSIRSEVILNGIDTDNFSPGDKNISRYILNLPQNQVVIGCAGRLEKEKDQATLIRALSQLPMTYCLALAGTGSQIGPLIALAKNLGLSDRVHFLQHQDNMVRFYHALDLFTLPSLNEGLPLAPLEAQSCNIPCILTDVGGCSESLCPATGILVQPKDPDAMARAIIHLMSKTITAQPRDFVIEHANAKNMTQKYHQLCLAS